ncbi:MAG: MFS transporter, partial [Endomicrobium sp.]|nr:MFS transporter [Endomicrobium sp.]
MTNTDGTYTFTLYPKGSTTPYTAEELDKLYKGAVYEDALKAALMASPYNYTNIEFGDNDKGDRVVTMTNTDGTYTFNLYPEGSTTPYTAEELDRLYKGAVNEDKLKEELIKLGYTNIEFGDNYKGDRVVIMRKDGKKQMLNLYAEKISEPYTALKLDEMFKGMLQIVELAEKVISNGFRDYFNQVFGADLPSTYPSNEEFAGSALNDKTQTALNNLLHFKYGKELINKTANDVIETMKQVYALTLWIEGLPAQEQQKVLTGLGLRLDQLRTPEGYERLASALWKNVNGVATPISIEEAKINLLDSSRINELRELIKSNKDLVKFFKDIFGADIGDETVVEPLTNMLYPPPEAGLIVQSPEQAFETMKEVYKLYQSLNKLTGKQREEIFAWLSSSQNDTLVQLGISPEIIQERLFAGNLNTPQAYEAMGSILHSELGLGKASDIETIINIYVAGNGRLQFPTGKNTDSMDTSFFFEERGNPDVRIYPFYIGGHLTSFDLDKAIRDARKLQALKEWLKYNYTNLGFSSRVLYALTHGRVINLEEQLITHVESDGKIFWILPDGTRIEPILYEDGMVRVIEIDELKKAVIVGMLKTAAANGLVLEGKKLNILEKAIYNEKTRKDELFFSFYYDEITKQFAGTKPGKGLIEHNISPYKADGSNMNERELALAILNTGELNYLEERVSAKYPDFAIEFDKGNLVWRINGHIIYPTKEVAKADQDRVGKTQEVKSFEQIVKEVEGAPVEKQLIRDMGKQGIKITKNSDDSYTVKYGWLRRLALSNSIAHIPSLYNTDGTLKKGQDFIDALAMEKRKDELLQKGFNIVQYYDINKYAVWRITHNNYKDESGKLIEIEVYASDNARVKAMEKMGEEITARSKFVSAESLYENLTAERIKAAAAKRGYIIAAGKNDAGDAIWTVSHPGAEFTVKGSKRKYEGYYYSDAYYSGKNERTPIKAQINVYKVIKNNDTAKPNLIALDYSELDGALAMEKFREEMEKTDEGFTIKTLQPNLDSEKEEEKYYRWEISHKDYGNTVATIFPYKKVNGKFEMINKNKKTDEYIYIKDDFIDALKAQKLLDAVTGLDKYKQYTIEKVAEENKITGLEELKYVVKKDGKEVTKIYAKDGALNFIGTDKDGWTLDKALKQFEETLAKSVQIAELRERNKSVIVGTRYRYLDSDENEYKVNINKNTGRREVLDLNGNLIQNQDIFLSEALILEVKAPFDGRTYHVYPVKIDGKVMTQVDFDDALENMPRIRLLRELMLLLELPVKKDANGNVIETKNFKFQENPKASKDYPEGKYNFYDKKGNLYYVMEGDSLILQEYKLYPGDASGQIQPAVEFWVAIRRNYDLQRAARMGRDGAAIRRELFRIEFEEQVTKLADPAQNNTKRNQFMKLFPDFSLPSGAFVSPIAYRGEETPLGFQLVNYVDEADGEDLSHLSSEEQKEFYIKKRNEQIPDTPIMRNGVEIGVIKEELSDLQRTEEGDYIYVYRSDFFHYKDPSEPNESKKNSEKEWVAEQYKAVYKDSKVPYIHEFVPAKEAEINANLTASVLMPSLEKSIYDEIVGLLKKDRNKEMGRMLANLDRGITSKYTLEMPDRRAPGAVAARRAVFEGVYDEAGNRTGIKVTVQESSDGDVWKDTGTSALEIKGGYGELVSSLFRLVESYLNEIISISARPVTDLEKDSKIVTNIIKRWNGNIFEHFYIDAEGKENYLQQSYGEYYQMKNQERIEVMRSFAEGKITKCEMSPQRVFVGESIRAPGAEKAVKTLSPEGLKILKKAGIIYVNGNYYDNESVSINEEGDQVVLRDVNNNRGMIFKAKNTGRYNEDGAPIYEIEKLIGKYTTVEYPYLADNGLGKEIIDFIEENLKDFGKGYNAKSLTWTRNEDLDDKGVSWTAYFEGSEFPVVTVKEGYVSFIDYTSKQVNDEIITTVSSMSMYDVNKQYSYKNLNIFQKIVNYFNGKANYWSNLLFKDADSKTESSDIYKRQRVYTESKPVMIFGEENWHNFLNALKSTDKNFAGGAKNAIEWLNKNYSELSQNPLGDLDSVTPEDAKILMEMLMQIEYDENGLPIAIDANGNEIIIGTKSYPTKPSDAVYKLVPSEWTKDAELAAAELSAISHIWQQLTNEEIDKMNATLSYADYESDGREANMSLSHKNADGTGKLSAKDLSQLYKFLFATNAEKSVVINEKLLKTDQAEYARQRISDIQDEIRLIEVARRDNYFGLSLTALNSVFKVNIKEEGFVTAEQFMKLRYNMYDENGNKGPMLTEPDRFIAQTINTYLFMQYPLFAAIGVIIGVMALSMFSRSKNFKAYARRQYDHFKNRKRRLVPIPSSSGGSGGADAGTQTNVYDNLTAQEAAALFGLYNSYVDTKLSDEQLEEHLTNFVSEEGAGKLKDLIRTGGIKLSRITSIADSAKDASPMVSKMVELANTNYGVNGFLSALKRSGVKSGNVYFLTISFLLTNGVISYDDFTSVLNEMNPNIVDSKNGLELENLIRRINRKLETNLLDKLTSYTMDDAEKLDLITNNMLPTSVSMGLRHLLKKNVITIQDLSEYAQENKTLTLEELVKKIIKDKVFSPQFEYVKTIMPNAFSDIQGKRHMTPDGKSVNMTEWIEKVTFEKFAGHFFLNPVLLTEDKEYVYVNVASPQTDPLNIKEHIVMLMIQQPQSTVQGDRKAAVDAKKNATSMGIYSTFYPATLTLTRTIIADAKNPAITDVKEHTADLIEATYNFSVIAEKTIRYFGTSKGRADTVPLLASIDDLFTENAIDMFFSQIMMTHPKIDLYNMSAEEISELMPNTYTLLKKEIDRKIRKSGTIGKINFIALCGKEFAKRFTDKTPGKDAETVAMTISKSLRADVNKMMVDFVINSGKSKKASDEDKKNAEYLENIAEFFTKNNDLWEFYAESKGLWGDKASSADKAEKSTPAYIKANVIDLAVNLAQEGMSMRDFEKFIKNLAGRVDEVKKRATDLKNLFDGRVTSDKYKTYWDVYRDLYDIPDTTDNGKNEAFNRAFLSQVETVKDIKDLLDKTIKEVVGKDGKISPESKAKALRNLRFAASKRALKELRDASDITGAVYDKNPISLRSMVRMIFSKTFKVMFGGFNYFNITTTKQKVLFWSLTAVFAALTVSAIVLTFNPAMIAAIPFLSSAFAVFGINISLTLGIMTWLFPKYAAGKTTTSWGKNLLVSIAGIFAFHWGGYLGGFYLAGIILALPSLSIFSMLTITLSGLIWLFVGVLTLSSIWQAAVAVFSHIRLTKEAAMKSDKTKRIIDGIQMLLFFISAALLIVTAVPAPLLAVTFGQMLYYVVAANLGLWLVGGIFLGTSFSNRIFWKRAIKTRMNEFLKAQKNAPILPDGKDVTTEIKKFVNASIYMTEDEKDAWRDALDGKSKSSFVMPKSELARRQIIETFKNISVKKLPELDYARLPGMSTHVQAAGEDSRRTIELM